jgi:hypothetical protein
MVMMKIRLSGQSPTKYSVVNIKKLEGEMLDRFVGMV